MQQLGAPPRVFISYARSDGEQIADGLRETLGKHNLPIWQDRVNMEGGRDWWQQIVDALNIVKFMVVVMTPSALLSPIIRKEWRYARQQGVCVYPIKTVPDLDFSNVPHWMSSVHWYDLEHEQEKFLNDLNRTCEKKYVPFMVSDLPDDYVKRPDEFEQLRKKLLDEARGEAIAITVALLGPGGYGKTTIARALCHDEGIQEAFDDGILWVTLGENTSNIISILKDLIYTLSHEKIAFDTLDAVTNRLSELLADRDILLVIDDVWDAAHLKPFLQGGKRCARLVTTRNEQTLPAEAERIKVDAMQVTEAVDLLLAGLEHIPDSPDERRKVQSLARRLGEWPLLLKLVNGILRDRMRNGELLTAALAFVNDALDEEGLTIFDDENTSDHHRAVARTIDISLQRLTSTERERYRELAIFPEDVDIPLTTLQRFWKRTGSLSRIKAELLCQRLANLSLLLEYNLTNRTIRLHDVTRSYLRKVVGDKISDLNQQFLISYKLAHWFNLPLDEPYLWMHLAEHLIGAQRANDLRTTVQDGNYLIKKAHLCGAYAVEFDLAIAELHNPIDISLSRLKHLFRGISHLLDQCATPSELAATLHTYLSPYPEFVEICASLEQGLARPFITAQHILPDQPPPTLIRTLHGHTDWVNGCAVSPSGEWIISCSDDETVKLWNAQTGQELMTFQGHTGGANGCAVSPSGEWIISCSDDKTVKLWNVQTGQELMTLHGHTDWVRGCIVSPSGEWIVSYSNDGTVKVWDVQTGQERMTLRGHTNEVIGCAISPSGEWIVSCSGDKTLKVWDMQTGQECMTLRGHTSEVIGCVISPSGEWIVSCSNDGTLKVWDTQTGQERMTLREHTNWVRGCAVSPSGEWIVSCSNDGAVKIWDAQTGQERMTFWGHTGSVSGIAVSPSGEWIVSCSNDKTLKMWNVQTGQKYLAHQGHTNVVRDCAVSPSGEWIVSCSDDGTLKLWDAQMGQERLTLIGHGSGVNGCAVSPSGEWIVSCSNDKTLKVWDAQTGQERMKLEGHDSGVNGCAVGPSGEWIVSCSWDETLKVWDTQTGEERAILLGHTNGVRECAVSPSGMWILSCSDDGTLKLWDALTGIVLSTLRVGTPLLTCAFSPDGEHIIAGGYSGLYFLRIVW